MYKPIKHTSTTQRGYLNHRFACPHVSAVSSFFFNLPFGRLKKKSILPENCLCGQKAQTHRKVCVYKHSHVRVARALDTELILIIDVYCNHDNPVLLFKLKIIPQTAVDVINNAPREHTSCWAWTSRCHLPPPRPPQWASGFPSRVFEVGPRRSPRCPSARWEWDGGRPGYHLRICPLLQMKTSQG